MAAGRGRKVNDVRFHLTYGFVIQAKPLHHARSHVLDYGVAYGSQAFGNLYCFWFLQIEGHALLVEIEVVEHAGLIRICKILTC